MGITRVKTKKDDLHVLDLSEYQFDTGLRGVAERVYIASKHAGQRVLKFGQFLFTSFLGLHYVYIISCALVLSWILFPERNISYTDALFQAVSAVTLTGLNTVNVNDLKLYQQIFLFIFPLLTHPLTVATFMVYYRLYMYRRKFSDIEETSKAQSKLRRTATFSQYESQNPRGDSGGGLFRLGRRPTLSRTLSKLNPRNRNEHEQVHAEEVQGDSHSSSFQDTEKDDLGATANDSSPNDSSPNDSSPNDQGGSKIQFGRLPKPGDHMEYPDPPNDGLAQEEREEEDEDEGPPLVIKSPLDIERDEKRGIHSAVKTTGRKNPDEPASVQKYHGKPLPSRRQGFAPGIERLRSDKDEDGNKINAEKGDGGDRGSDNDEEEPSKIRFGALPRPRPRDHPRDMYRSINMMREQSPDDGMEEGEGPALVIKSPRDIEADERRGIHSAVAEHDSRLRRDDESVRSGPSRRLSGFSGLGPRIMSRVDTLMSEASSHHPREMRANYLSYMPTIGRNSAFIGLTREQKEELGGVEYRALKALRWVTLVYFIVMLSIGWVFLIPWTYAQGSYDELIRSYGVSPVLFSMTTTLSGFTNNGFCSLPTSIAPFWHTAYVPLVVTFVMFSGNVGVPIIMRYGVWGVFKLSPRFGQTRETLGFLLDHPRRCFMLLFPAITTLWLILTLLLFLVIEVALFMILNSGSHSPQPDMAAGPRLLSAYFQSITVRTVGFTIIDVANQHPGMLVLNIVMMYVAIYPVAMSIRKTNVYEEQTIGRYYREPQSRDMFGSDTGSVRSSSSNAIESDDEDDDSGGTSGNVRTQGWDGPQLRRRLSNFSVRMLHPNENKPKTGKDKAEEEEEMDEEDDDSPSTLVDHMRRQLSMDVWSLVLGMLLVAITEGGPIDRNEFSLFSVMYEVVSAHGTVGLTMGYGTLALSGAFSNLGKLVMMAIMIRGRHRAMPYNVDRAVILHGKDLRRRDKEQENRVRNAKMYVHREPTQSNGTWLPRVGTAATRLASYGTQRRPSTVRAREEV